MQSSLLQPRTERFASVFDRLFGGSTAAERPTEQLLADLRRDAIALLEDVSDGCTSWRHAPADEASQAVRNDVEDIARIVRSAAQRLPLPDDPLRGVLLGRTQAGKSTLFSFLTGTDASPVGHGAQRCTRSVVAMPMAGRTDVVLVDTPGVGALDGDEDRELALDAARSADLVVWVATTNSQPSATAAALTQVARWGAPMLLVFNCREDLVGDGAVGQFIAYPESTFAELDGHRARLARFLDPYGQRPVTVVPIHAAAALLGGRANPPNADLLRESRVDGVVEAIRAEADERWRPRRAAAIVDTARRALTDAAERLTADSEGLAIVAGTRRDEGADFDRRAARLVADVDLQVQGEIDALFRRFDDWADRHYQRKDAELQKAWDADERNLRDEAEKLLGGATTRLIRRLRELDEEVAAAWSKRLEAGLTKRNRISAAGIAPRWLEAAGRTGAAALGSYLGFLIGGALGNAPGATLGTMLGGFVGDRLGSLLRLRRGQLARRRTSLHESVREALGSVRSDFVADWGWCRDAVEKDLASRASDRSREIERIADLARHAFLAAESATRAVASLDACLLRASLRLEGRDRLADRITTVTRRPGFASLVLLSDSAALREIMLRPPNQVPEQVRPVPDEEDASVFRRAAYALVAGPRHAVLVPVHDGIRADIPEHLSADMLAAEAALIATVVAVPLDLRSINARLAEPAA